MNQRIRVPFRGALAMACAALAFTAGCSPQAAGDGAAEPDRPVQADAALASPVVPQPAPADPDADLERARAAAAEFGGQLRGRLQAAMAEGGPVAAVEVCHEEAPRIADAVMAGHGLRLGRVAAPGRNRNPAHAADDWRLAMLRTFQANVDAGAAAADQVAVRATDLPEGVALRMMRGIATEPGCLACHGSDVAPEVRDAIAARYPGDGATGFAVGDLRGALWVEVPSTASPLAH